MWLTTARLELALRLRISNDKTTKIGRPITSVSEPLSSLMARSKDFGQLPSKLLTKVTSKLVAVNATLTKSTVSGTTTFLGQVFKSCRTVLDTARFLAAPQGDPSFVLSMPLGHAPCSNRHS